MQKLILAGLILMSTGGAWADSAELAQALQKVRTNCSGISGAGCVKMYEEYPLRLPGGLELPIALVKETYSYYNMINSAPINPVELNWLPQQSDQYLLAHMVAGEIIEVKCNTQMQDSCCYLSCEYICREMIGVFRSEETIGTDEQRD